MDLVDEIQWYIFLKIIGMASGFGKAAVILLQLERDASKSRNGEKGGIVHDELLGWKGGF